MYLRITGNTFGFVSEDTDEIKEDDIEITEDDYEHFKEIQSQGKDFRLKEIPTGNSLFDYIEGYIPKGIIIPQPEKEALQEEVLLLTESYLDMEFRMTNYELGL